MFAIPVSFAKHHKDMQAHCIELLEHKNGHMAIHPKFNKIITSLRTAVEDGLGNLDKRLLHMIIYWLRLGYRYCFF